MTSNQNICWVLLAWPMLVTAQVAAPTLADADAQRARLAQERAAHEAVFVQAKTQCYQRFAVSDCLTDARRARRAALDELRRQELLLNDQERQAKAIDAQQRIQEKLAEPR